MNSFIRSLVLNFKNLREKLWSVEKNHSSRQMWAEETIERMFDQNHLIPGKVCYINLNIKIAIKCNLYVQRYYNLKCVSR